MMTTMMMSMLLTTMNTLSMLMLTTVKEYLTMMLVEMMIPMSRLVLDHREGSFFHCPSLKQELHVSPGLKTRACKSWTWRISSIFTRPVFTHPRFPMHIHQHHIHPAPDHSDHVHSSSGLMFILPKCHHLSINSTQVWRRSVVPGNSDKPQSKIWPRPSPLC